MSKISIIGAGNVGSSCADYLVTQSIGDEVVLLDITPGVAEGKALDIRQKAHLINSTSSIQGVTNDYETTKDSQIVVITSGARRQAHQSRSDILGINASIIESVTKQVLTYSPDALLIMVSNPLDIMCYYAQKTSAINHQRIIGMAGMLDTARFKTFVAEELGVSAQDIDALLLGGHGDTMVPLPRHTRVKGRPITDLLSEEKLANIIERTKKGGAEVTGLMGTSAYFCPGTAAALMAKAILHDERVIYPCSCYANGVYGLEDLYIGLPVVLGKNGIEKIVKIDLNTDELALLHASAKKVQETMTLLTY